MAVLEQLLLDVGQNVGVFTSPHFLHYCERIRVNGQPVSEQEVCEAFARIDSARQEISLTYFEFGTLAALDLFARRGVDTQILEVGLGGRLDAVNLVDADVAVVTSIAIDHEEWLGSDREIIGREKAGIFRRDKPAICVDPEPPASIAAVAAETGADLRQVDRQWHYQAQGELWSFEGQSIGGDLVAYQSLPIPNLPIPSAAAALQAALLLGVAPVAAKLSETLKQVTLPGRFQQVNYKDRNFVLDVAHNPAAAEYLAERLRAKASGGDTWALVAMMADKDRRASLSALQVAVDHWLVADLPDNSRAASAEALQEDLAVLGITAEACADVEQAIAQVLAQSAPGDRIVVAGSFFTVAAALKLIEEV